MTNKQALVRGVLASFTIDDFQADKALLDAGIKDYDNYNPSNEKSLDACAVKILHGMCVRSVTEAGYSVSFDLSRAEAFAEHLCDKWGLDNPFVPTINAVNKW